MTTFIEIQDRCSMVYTVNASHILKMYYCSYQGDTWTRVILTTGGGMIDSPLTIDQILARIKSATE